MLVMLVLFNIHYYYVEECQSMPLILFSLLSVLLLCTLLLSSAKLAPIVLIEWIVVIVVLVVEVFGVVYL